MIARDLEAAARSSYDLAIVGGGVYGVALTLEAARRGLEPLLIERRDFGGETSWNSLRVVHGGLRYLQALDLRRFRESVAARSSWLSDFPDLVQPLPCLMPLYGRGLRRPSVFRAAFTADCLLSLDRNRTVRPDRQIRAGRILTPAAVLEAAPQVDPRRLVGGALWHDAAMPDSQRLLVEMLHWASACGASTLNYVQATHLLTDGGQVKGLEVLDIASGKTLTIAAPVVVNCAGPWCREVAREFDRDVPHLFHPSIAFNALLDRAPLFEGALAVEAPTPGGRTYFLHGWKGRILAGTYHSRWSKSAVSEDFERQLVARFVNDLNAAIPDFNLDSSEISRVHWGFLPARQNGSEDLATREVIQPHSDLDGPAGLFSVSGVKFTTARSVAKRTLRHVLGALGRQLPAIGSIPRPPTRRDVPWSEFEGLLNQDRAEARKILGDLAREEAVVQLEDLLFRRTDWGSIPSEIESRVLQLTSVLASGAEKLGALEVAPNLEPASRPSWALSESPIPRQ